MNRRTLLDRPPHRPGALTAGLADDSVVTDTGSNARASQEH
jgi:hypothetical protein